MAKPIDLQTIKAKLQDIYDSGNSTEAYTITMTGVELAITILLLGELEVFLAREQDELETEVDA